MNKHGMTPEKALEVWSKHKASNLKATRIKKGFSQGKLAKEAGVSLRTVVACEQGERNIDRARIDTVCKLAAALDCKIEDILQDEKFKELYKLVK